MSIKHWVVIVLIVVSLIGFVDSAYLTAQHYSGEEVVCNVGARQLGNCNTVLTSEYATIFGVPTAGLLSATVGR